jgi:hypothetical protein
MATEDYVPVAGDDWYERRREDAEGRFFRNVADQGPRKGEGGSTRQGIYCFTADGHLLAYKNAQDPAVMRDVLRQGLGEWARLPAERRRAGAVQVGDPGSVDAHYSRTPPPGALVVNVYTRILDRTPDGELCHGNCRVTGGDLPARDHLWITAADCRALLPAEPRKGETYPLPRALAERILRFHLTDNTRGEPPLWTRDQIRSQDVTLTVEEANAEGVTLRLEGTALLATNADPAKADRGYDVHLVGRLHYDAARRKWDRFDMAAVGDHWGEGTFTRNARPGHTPLGVLFELAGGDSPADKVPPQGAREWDAYIGRAAH